MRQFKYRFLLENPLAALTAGLQLIRKKTLLDYRLFANGFSLYPSTIVFHPTARCNLNCKMCVVNSYSFPRELTLTQIKKIMDQIFIPFYTTRKQGTGIGLALSKQIMRMHKGSIEVKSEPGKTEFVLKM